MSNQKSSFWTDFKKFITRGNVVDMAVGIVIGGAFGKIVTGLVNYVINPCVSILTKGADLDSIKTPLVEAKEAVEAVTNEAGEIVTPAVEAVEEVSILWGTWFQTIVDFLIVAFCIFFVLRIIMRAKNTLQEAELKAAAEAAAAKIAADEIAAAAAAEIAATEAAKKAAVEDSILKQEKLLEQLVENMKK